MSNLLFRVIAEYGNPILGKNAYANINLIQRVFANSIVLSRSAAEGDCQAFYGAERYNKKYHIPLKQDA